MQKIFICSILLLGLLFGTNLHAQEALKDTTWKTGGVISVNFSQAYYENWTAGGIPSVSGVGFLKLFATYTKEKWRWDNQLDLAYGLIRERESISRKTDDKINFDTKLGYSVGGNWHASLLGSFRTQFTPGYEDPETELIKISDFMSPGYLTISLGMDHNPNENLSIFIAPVALKTTFVLDQALADNGAFGVQSGEWETIVRDSTVDSNYVAGKRIRYEIGAHFKLRYVAKVMTNVEFQTKLELYANYLDNVGNIDVNWEGLLNMKINDLLSANIRVEVIYDDDIAIPIGIDPNGNTTYGPRMQLKQLFGLGLAYNF